MAEQYLPLYRKYRPQQFSDLVGQENLVKAFTNAINTGKIAHAYLFCGPRGTGKTSSARILAKSLNCQNGPTLEPCGKCPSCLDILNGNMLDVIEMDAASNRSVEDAQNIIDKIHYAPINGKYKIFIIDEVHMISKTAFNALLKTLEEPPENVVFILATTEPQKVLETIISRCQRFDFRRITVEDIVKRLKFISEKEGIKISDEALNVIAKNSQGGMRDALALLDQISVLDMKNEITPDQVNEMLGKIDNKTLIELAQNIFAKSVDNAVQIINNIYSKGNEPLQIIENFIQFSRNLSIIKSCKDIKTIADLTLLSDDTIKEMKNVVENISIGEIATMTEKLSTYYKEIKYTNNRYLWLELCFMDLASQKCVNTEFSKDVKPVTMPKAKPVEIKQELKIEKTETKQIEKPTPVNEEPKTEKAEEIKEPEIDETTQDFTTPAKPKEQTSQDVWKSILASIESPPSRSFFTTFAKLDSINEQKITVFFKNENLKERAKEPSKFDALKKACLVYLNVPSVDIEMKVGEPPVQKVQNPIDEVKTVKPQPIQPSQTVKTEPIKEEIKTDTTPETEDELVKIESVSTIKENNYDENDSDQVRMFKELFDAKPFEG